MLDHLPAKPRRGELADVRLLCDHCVAKCCRYFALPIERPKDREDYEFIRWFLMHEHASVFEEDDHWYLLVSTPCKHLQQDHRCGIYETRPQICRDYSTSDCEYEDDWTYQRFWESSEQVAEYMEAVLGPAPGQGLRSPQPPLLPVIG